MASTAVQSPLPAPPLPSPATLDDGEQLRRRQQPRTFHADLKQQLAGSGARPERVVAGDGHGMLCLFDHELPFRRGPECRILRIPTKPPGYTEVMPPGVLI